MLWKPLVERFKACVERSLDGTSLSFADIDNPMLVGGSPRLGFLRDAMAEVMGRESSEILVCTDSERIVSQGAAEHAFYQDDASQVLENGLGLSVFDRDLQRHRNLLLVAPGQVLSAEGFFMERSGFDIGVMNGCSALVCKPFVCRSGVRAAVVKGRDTFLEDTETIRLQEVHAPLDDLRWPHTTSGDTTGQNQTWVDKRVDRRCEVAENAVHYSSAAARTPASEAFPKIPDIFTKQILKNVR